MSTNTIPRDYVVTIRIQKLRHPPSSADPIEHVEVVAYDINEAAVSAFLKLQAMIGGFEDHGLQANILNVEPKCESVLAWLENFGLRLMPAIGQPS